MPVLFLVSTWDFEVSVGGDRAKIAKTPRPPRRRMADLLALWRYLFLGALRGLAILAASIGNKINS
jgi:hypothetical protein